MSRLHWVTLSEVRCASGWIKEIESDFIFWNKYCRLCSRLSNVTWMCGRPVHMCVACSCYVKREEIKSNYMSEMKSWPHSVCSVVPSVLLWQDTRIWHYIEPRKVLFNLHVKERKHSAQHCNRQPSDNYSYLRTNSRIDFLLGLFAAVKLFSFDNFLVVKDIDNRYINFDLGNDCWAIRIHFDAIFKSWFE